MRLLWTWPLLRLLGWEIQCLAKWSPYAGPSAGKEVARLRKWHVWCLLEMHESCVCTSVRTVTKTTRWRSRSPCNPAAETATQPLTQCSVGFSSQGSSPEECFFHRHPLVVHYIVLAATTNARRTRKNACVTVRSVNTSGPLCQDIFLKIRLHRTLGNKDRDQLRATLEQPFSSTYIYIYIYICIHIICIYIHRYIPLVLWIFISILSSLSSLADRPSSWAPPRARSRRASGPWWRPRLVY